MTNQLCDDIMTNQLCDDIMTNQLCDDIMKQKQEVCYDRGSYQ